MPPDIRYKGENLPQEDSWYVSPHTINGRLVLVADGVGGHAHGEFASELCVSVYEASFEADPMIIDEKKYLLDMAQDIARQVYAKSKDNLEYSGCGTTLTGFLISGNRYHLINIGDSRVYLFNHDQKLIRLTRDHSIVQQLLNTGKITEEQARAHPKRNVILSAIGQEPEKIHLDTYGPFELCSGEILLAFSDGVHDALPDEEILRLILKNRQNPDLCRILVDAAFEAGGKDNITACCYLH